MNIYDSSIFREYHLDQDPTCLHSVARAILALQAVFGVIPNVYGKGKAAKQVFEYVTKLRKESVDLEPKIKPKINNIVILDRQVIN